MTVVAAPGRLRPDLLPTVPQTIPPAYLGHPHLTESEGHSPELRELWPSLEALDPRRGATTEYGLVQWEAVLSAMGEVVTGFVAG